MTHLSYFLVFCLFLHLVKAIQTLAREADPLNSKQVVVYGSSGAACIAAVAASRSGVSNVTLLSQTNHLGGMLTGGLQHTDSANDTVVQGITREFFIKTENKYPGRPTDANYPPWS